MKTCIKMSLGRNTGVAVFNNLPQVSEEVNTEISGDLSVLGPQRNGVWKGAGH